MFVSVVFLNYFLVLFAVILFLSFWKDWPILNCGAPPPVKKEPPKGGVEVFVAVLGEAPKLKLVNAGGCMLLLGLAKPAPRPKEATL